MDIRCLAARVRIAYVLTLTLVVSVPAARAATDVTVTVAQGGVGVEGAFVAVIGAGAQKFAGVTDATGKVVFSQLPDGTFTVIASAPRTSSNTASLSTPGETAKTINVIGSATVFSGLPAYGSQTGAIVPDGLSGVFYLNTSSIPSVYRTADHGGTWAPVTVSGDDNRFGIDGSTSASLLTTSGFPGEVAAVAGNPARLYYSRDFGVTWSSFPLPAVPASPGSKLLWSHPASAGALSILFYASSTTSSLSYVSMPAGAVNTVPTGFTTMTNSYRASAADPIAIANGSNAGVFVVGATTTSATLGRTAGDIKFYVVSAAPDGATDTSATINNGLTPGAVPTVAFDGSTALTPADLFLVRLGGPNSGATIGSTVTPNTLLVYSAKTDDAAAAAAMTTCAGTVCTATLTTTFRDQSDTPTSAATFGFGTSTLQAACAATRSASAITSISPVGSAGTLGGCWITRSGGAMDVRPVFGINNNTSMAFDAGFNGTTNSVMISGDGSKGAIKSARAGTNGMEGVSRPYFPQWPSAAVKGTATSSGGMAINGVNSAVVRDIAFNPSSASQLVAVLAFTGGGRVAGSSDSGKTWFDIFGRGGDSIGWWNAGGGPQWMLAGVGVGGDLLGGTQITTAAPFSASTRMTQIQGTSSNDLGLGGGGSASQFVVTAVEGLTSSNTAIVAAARTNSGSIASGFAQGSLSLVTLSAPGPTASITRPAGWTFTNSAPVAFAYCGGSAPASVADRMFVAMASSAPAGTTGGIKFITAASQSTRALQSLPAITGDFQAVRVDCASGTVWAGKNTVAVGAPSSSGTRGLLKSTDGGSSFATIAATGRPGEILQKVRAIAIDPRSPNHVIVMSTDTDVVETKDGGFTWTVLNDSTTAACPTTATTPCGRAFGAEPSALEMPPKVAVGGSVTTANLRASSKVDSDQAVTGSGAGLYAVTTRSILRTSLTFSGVIKGTTPIISSSQQVSLSFAQSGVTWTAASDQPFVAVTPSSGTGNGSFAVSINSTAASLQPGTYAATITVQTTGGLVSTQTIPVVFTVLATSAPPFGAFDTPADQASGLQGSLAVTGWALDDIGIEKVELWRDLQAGETTPPVVTDPPTDPRNGKVFIATTTFVDGARPDVEAQFTTSPQNYRAGWGYLMLTWGLNNQGNGPYTLYAFAFDKDGNVSSIGSKAIHVSNTAANKPFGSVDTPGIGATISGTVVNFGWGLTPKVNGAATCKIQPSGVQVSIDSGPLQPVVYGGARGDIAAAFNGFSNSTAAGGHYIVDTTLFANGVHTIGWLITDDCSRADGVGSRFFTIQNSGALAGSRAALAPTVQVQAAENGVDSPDAVTVAHGYGNLPAIVTPDSTGLRMVRVVQGDRIEVRLPRGYDEASQRVNGVQRALPAGATWDGAGGTFYWQPAAAFLGSYELVFVRDGEQIRVRVFVDVRRNH